MKSFTNLLTEKVNSKRVLSIIFALLCYSFTGNAQLLTADAGTSFNLYCTQTSVVIGGAPTASGGTGPYTYSWSPSLYLDDSTSSNPNVDLSTLSTFTLSATTYTVTVTDASLTTATAAITIIYNPTSSTAIAGSNMSDCRQQVFSFEGLGSGASFHWDFGDGNTADYYESGTTQDHTFSAPGFYNAILTVYDYNGCPATDSLIVHAKGPAVNAGGDAYNNYSVCGTVVDFSNASTDGVNYYWSFGCDCVADYNLNPVFDYQYYGYYVATLYATDNDGCENSSSAYISLNEQPAANAGPDQTVCTNSTVYLGDASSIGQMNWWDFGDGGTGYGLSTSYYYSTPGTYYAVLTSAFDNNCGSSSDTAIITVTQPYVDFGGDQSVCGQTVNFVSNAPTAVSYYWSFGDDYSDYTSNPTYTYSSYGTYNVYLEVTDADGCYASTTANITLDQPPFADAGLDLAGCANSPVNLNAYYSNGNSYTWDSGDGQIYNNWDVIHTYTTGGTYYATMTVSNLNSCPDAVDTAVVTVSQPTADAGPDQYVCFTGGVVSFVGNATDATSYLWTFGDGNSDTLQNTAYTYSYASPYLVTFTAYNGTCSASSTFIANVETPPVADAGVDLVGCANSPVTLDAFYSNGSTYNWNFGDGQTYNGWYVYHTYTTGGTYYATMTVSNLNSCPDAVDTAVVTVSQPTADAGPDQYVCFTGGTVSFVGNSTNATSYLWNFGDGNSDTLQNTSHSYSASSPYTVTFTAYNGTCSASSTFIANVEAPPVADAGLDLAGCANSPVTLDAFYSNGSTYNWNFGDGQTYNGWYVYHTYTTGGTYYATMTVSNLNSCPDAVDTAVVTVSQPTADAGPDQYVCFTGGTVSFVGNATNATSYLWNFGDGNYDTLQTTSHNYTYLGTFIVSFTATTAGGCSTTDTAIVNVFQPLSGSQTVSICAGQSFAIGTSSYNVSGIYNDVLTSFQGCDSTVTTNLTVNSAISGSQTSSVCAGGSVTVGTNTYTSSGIYNDVLTAYNGCDSTVTTNLTVYPVITGMQTITVCAGGNVTVGSSTYTATGNYTDILTSYTGCDSTVTTNLNVIIQLAVNTSVINSCYGVSQTLSAIGGDGNYYWSPALGLSTSTGISVTATPSVTTLYYVTDTVSGCPMIDSTLINVNLLLIADAGAHQSLCLGDTAVFIATGVGGSGSYTYGWNDGSNFYNTDTINVVPSTNLTYTLTVTDLAGCFATDTVTFASRHTDIYGLVTYSGGILSHGANNIAVLYRWYNPNLSQFDTVQLSVIDTTTGYFHFANVYNNNLIVKIFPDTLVYNHHFVPSYYNLNNLPTSLWDATTYFTHTCNAEDTLDIVMTEQQPLSGVARLSGRVTQGPFYYPMANGLPRSMGDPVPGADVKIGTNPGGQMVVSTSTSPLSAIDGGGYFYFDSIPAGTYDIYVDIPGLLRDSVWTITVSATDTVFADLNYMVDSSDVYPIYPDINVQVPEVIDAESIFTVYPNPFRNNATIEYNVNKDADVKLELYSLVGDKIQTLVNSNLQAGKYEYYLNSPTKKLSNGVYFIKLSIEGRSVTQRIIVME